MHDPRVAQSMDLWNRACEVIPGGAQLVSRRPTRFACGVSPVYAARASGARIVDVDGNEYIDWVSGIGAIILGYADPVVDAAVRQQQVLGTVYSINHPLEIELAETLIDAVPCAEMVRYARGGGEACAMAVRIARGVTGRDLVLCCGYHGWHDWYLAANLTAGDALGEHLFSGIAPIGVPQGLAQTALPFPYGDLAALEERLNHHRDKVAAIIMEPLRSQWPPAGYLEGVRQLASRHGVVLIFDEVSTGLRFSPGGVQPVLGVVPDMAVLAKSLSNGYAMGAVVGTREVMQPAAQMFISSTYWGETIGLRAALTTLQEVRKRDVPGYLDQLGTDLQQRLNQVAIETGAPIRCEGVAVHPQLVFDVEDAELQAQAATLYIQEMARRGCHGYPSFYLNAAQGEPELQQTVTAAGEVFGMIAEGLHRGDLDRHITCQPRQEVFRRLVT